MMRWPAASALVSAWMNRYHLDASNLGDDAKTVLLAATSNDSGLDHDPARLVRSAATPGLANRIRAFVETQFKK